jgi:predicted phage baseplate assembly protein
MNETCGCCEGIERLTPLALLNRPGLDALLYRVGTHASFFETMLARLSQYPLEIALDEFDEQGRRKIDTLYPLRGLTTRDPSDPAIALLDAWATVADVLTFYQERIANEGYLRTATERRSILELARLVGYALRPGVAASVYLAYTLETGHDVTIQPGNRAQSVPGPGELPQSFETADKLEAHAGLNALKPRLSQPQYITRTLLNQATPIYFTGIANNLKPNDSILFFFSSAEVLYQVLDVKPDPLAGRTLVTLTLRDTAAVPTPPTPTPALALKMQQIGAIFKTYAQARDFGIDPTSATAKTILALLKEALLTLLGNLITPAELNDLPKETNDPSKDVLRLLKVALLKLLGSPITPDQLKADLQKETSVLSGEIEELLTKLDDLSEAIASEWLAALKQDTLPKLHDEYASASTRGYTKIAAWLRGMLTELDAALVSAPALERTSDGDGDGNGTSRNGKDTASSPFIKLLQPLKLAPSVQPANMLRLDRSVEQLYSVQADTVPRLFSVLYPQLRTRVYDLLANTSDGAPDRLNDIQVLRVKAALFGSNAPAQPVFDPPLGSANSAIVNYTQPTISNTWGALANAQNGLKMVALDAQYDQIKPNSFIAIERPAVADAAGGGGIAGAASGPIISYHQVDSVRTVALSALGVSTRVTVLDLKTAWLSSNDQTPPTDLLRGTTVYAQSEPISSAEEPLTDDIAQDRVELDGLYRGLEAGRWAIIVGERTDITGVVDAELVMLAEVTQDVKQIQDAGKTFALPADKLHTFVRFASPLAYRYKRDTVTIYGNVVRSTHGETRSEALGSGDGSKALQTFALRQSPLTYLAAPTPAGAESTLDLRVNDVRWHVADNLAALGPTDHRYITRTDDDGKTSVVFGNGRHGARLPTGVENVKAVYRTGIGKPGNVGAKQISLLATKPLGVKSVINPLPASGGADRESITQARRNVPIGAIALDRLVSVSDYADFARTFAGIGKASAALLSNGQRLVVYLTIAGADNIPIDLNSDLYHNLVRALRRSGDPYQPLKVFMRELLLLVISAGVRLQPDYLWEAVEPQIRAALLDTFSFERRELGQDVFRSEAISAIQSVPGVAYVDLDIFDAVGEAQLANPNLAANLELRPRIVAEPARTNDDQTSSQRILPAQMIFLTPDVRDTLMLAELPS